MKESIVPEIQTIEMPSGVFLISLPWIMGSCNVPMTVPGKYIKGLQRRDTAQSIWGNGNQMIVDQMSGFLAESKATFTLAQ